MFDSVESTTCAQCGAADGHPWLVARDVDFDGIDEFQLVSCNRCGLRYLNPRPTPVGIEASYPSSYYTHAAMTNARAARTYRVAARLVERYGRRGRILDIGSGDGAFLSLVRANGWTDVAGIEPDSAARRIAVDVRGLAVAPGMFPEDAPSGAEFDTVCMLEAIEHLHEPLAALRRVRELLVPGGRFIMSTPNVDGLEFRLLGGRAVSLQVPRHLYFFNVESLTRMLCSAGLRVLVVKTDGSWAGLTRSLWLHLRPALIRPAGWPHAPLYQPNSWRRRVHEALDAVLMPAALVTAMLGYGPTLMVVAERPLDP